MLKIIPLLDRVLIRKPDTRMTASGLHVPQTAVKDKTTVIGIVEAVGPGIVNEQGKFVEVKARVGSKVLITKYAGAEVDLHDRIERVVVRDHEILADVTDDEQPPSA